ncbi:MAG: putative N-acetyltransferase YitI [Bacteroidia bacterium]|nr:MAG: putative N-acetyltransferase YitI [Bacteroidia bacterium]
MSPSVLIVSAETVLPLRWAVLRPGWPREAARFEGDTDKRTYHFAAYTPSGEVVGVASFFQEPYPPLGEGPSVYRLRGMATHPAYQRQAGIGRTLLQKALSFLARQGITLVWCYARVEAVPFYAKQGFLRWEAAGIIDIPGVGPHEVWYYPLAKGTAVSGV